MNVLQNSLKKLGVNTIQGIEEVNMIRDDGHVLHFINPKGNRPPKDLVVIYHTHHVHMCTDTRSLSLKYSPIPVQASLAANTFAITGNPEEKRKFIFTPI